MEPELGNTVLGFRLCLFPGRWNKYDVMKLIEFNTIVRHVTFDDVTNQFSVVTEQV